MGYAHGTQWTEELIIKYIKDVVNKFNLDRMPSKSEVDTYYNGTGLSNAISRRWGFYGLAKMLGLDIKKSDTYIGKQHEEIMNIKIKDMGFLVERMSQNYPYDLLVNKIIKVDVKVSRLYNGPNGNFFTFNLEKKFRTCDIFTLLCLNDNNEITREYILPSVFVPNNTQISIGEFKSKYSRFLNRWDYFDIYNEFAKQVISF